MTTDSLFTQVRYYTQFDPYFFSVDNRPLQDLAYNDEILATAIDNININVLSLFSAPTGATLVSNQRSFSGSVVKNLHNYIESQVLNAVSDLGADPTGITDNTTIINNAITTLSASGGGSIYFPPGTYIGNFILKTGVFLWGAVFGFGYLAGGSPVTQTKFTAFAAGAVIDTPVTAISNCGVIGINAQGLGSGISVKGIHFRNVAYGFIRNFHANNMADEGILVDVSSIACTFEDILIFNSVLNRTRAAKIGSFDIDGTDHFLNRIEAGISGQAQGTVQSASLWCVAFMIRATNCKQIIGLTAEFSDVGIEITGSLNPFSQCSSELNYGHGWNVVGSGNRFSICQSLNNSQDTTNTYDNWITAGVNNVFSSPTSISQNAKVPRYAFNDTAPSSATNKNYYNDPRTSGTHGTALYNHTAGFSAAWRFTKSAALILTSNSTTPNVAGQEFWRTGNTNPTTITDFPGGVNGQELNIVINDVNTTFQHNGATIVMPNAGNVKARNGQTYLFRKNGAWSLVSEDSSFSPNVSADNGDAIKTLQHRVSESTQRWATPLTTNRAVTLSTTGAAAGAKFHIVRQAGATGGSTLDIGTGPLKSLAVSQWCNVEYDGAAWFLSAFGSL